MYGTTPPCEGYINAPFPHISNSEVFLTKMLPLNARWSQVLLQTFLLLHAGAHCRLFIDPPEVIWTNSLEKSTTLRQRDVQFSCHEVTPNDTALSSPREDVVWTKDGVPLNFASGKYGNDVDMRRLSVQNVSETDTGVYECAYEFNSTDRGSATLWISPYIIYAPTPQILRPGELQIVECIVSSGVRHVKWTKDGQLVATSDSVALLEALNDRYNVLPNGSLLISNVKTTDAGVYECMVYNKAGNDSSSVQLSTQADKPLAKESTIINLPNTTKAANREPPCVFVTDYHFGQSPVILTEPNNSSPTRYSVAPVIVTISPSCLQSIEGHSIILNCTASGQPSPTIRWEKDSNLIATNNNTSSQTANGTHIKQLSDGSLLIDSLGDADRGNYTCRATSSAGTTAKTIALKVQCASDLCGFSSTSTQGTSAGFVQTSAGVRKKRIYGGLEVTTPNKWPWQVILEFPSFQGPVESICSGALIRPDLVLTAAHCVGKIKKPCDVVVRAGIFNRSAHEDAQQTLPVKTICTHKLYRSYDSATQPHDIALLKLAIPAQMTTSVGLVCLPPEGQDPPPKTFCTVTGWGHLTEDSTVSPDLLREALVPLVSNSVCNKAYQTVSSNWLCAGYLNGTQDACQNDSGGPLVCSQGKRWTEYGIVISGDGCGRANKYGIYTRVSKFLDWIRNATAELASTVSTRWCQIP